MVTSSPIRPRVSDTNAFGGTPASGANGDSLRVRWTPEAPCSGFDWKPLRTTWFCLGHESLRIP